MLIKLKAAPRRHIGPGLVFFLSCYDDSASFLSGAVPPLISIWETVQRWTVHITRSSACSHTLTSGSESKWETLLKPPEYQTDSKWKPRPASELRPFMLWDNRADHCNTMSLVSFVKIFYEASLWNKGPLESETGINWRMFTGITNDWSDVRKLKRQLVVKRHLHTSV